MSGLTLSNLTKRFGNTVALDRVSFEVPAGQIVAVLGPSGSGKSTLLYVIAGIEAADGGQVCWDGEDLAGVPTHRRGFGLMFQDYALFPHKSVFDNVAFGLRMAGRSEAAIRAAVAETLETVGLASFEKRNVNSLSGGEAQRVALARALAPRPRLLMLDEPLGALDRNLRERLMTELPAMLRRLGQTAMYVTHDQEEAFAVANRIVLLHRGGVAQTGRPAEVYNSPRSEFVARFLGLTNLLAGTVEAGHPLRVRTTLGTLRATAPPELPPAAGQPVTVLLRPEAATRQSAARAERDAETNHVSGVVRELSFRGASTRVSVEVNGAGHMAFEFPGHLALPDLGESITLSIPPEGVQVVKFMTGES